MAQALMLRESVLGHVIPLLFRCGDFSPIQALTAQCRSQSKRSEAGQGYRFASSYLCCDRCCSCIKHSYSSMPAQAWACPRYTQTCPIVAGSTRRTRTLAGTAAARRPLILRALEAAMGRASWVLAWSAPTCRSAAFALEGYTTLLWSKPHVASRDPA